MSGSEVPGVESYVQIAPDSTGKKVRNLLVAVPAPDGSMTTAYLQVVALAGPDGFPLTDPGPFQEELLGLLRDIKSGIELLHEELQ